MDRKEMKDKKAWICNLSLVIGGLLVLLCFCTYCYLRFVREENQYIFYMKEEIDSGEIRQGTPDGEFCIPIPKSVKSREDFMAFCMSLLDNPNVWVKKFASEYLTRLVKKSDPVYDTLREKMWEQCNSDYERYMLGHFISYFGYLVDESYTDEIISQFNKESDKHVRVCWLGCLGRIGNQKSTEFLKHIALDSKNSDDAYAAAMKFVSKSSAGAIEVVRKYLARDDAKRKSGGPSSPEYLEYMKRRYFYRVVSLALVLVFPILLFPAHLALRKRTLPVVIWRVVIVEIILLLGYFGSRHHWVLTALGGGDTGAFSDSYRESMNCIFLSLLMCLYVVNVFICQKYLLYVKRLMQNELTKAFAMRGNVLFAFFFVNLALIMSYFDLLIHAFP